MGLFSSDNTPYKGYELIKGEDGRYIVRTPGPYGVKVGDADDKAGAKRVVDGLK